MDVTKAYDKAWLDGIMYVLHKEGVQNRLWLLVKKLNSNLKTTIMTKHGPTDEIEITDSIRQGGVLAVTMYAVLIDEINKEIAKTNYGIDIPNIDLIIACLEWVDDVVLAELKAEFMQILLHITNHISQKYHIEFGMIKTKCLETVGIREKFDLKLGDKDLEKCLIYTYLGLILNHRMNLKDQILTMTGKVEAAYQNLMAVMEDNDFKEVKMEGVWLLVKLCIVPIITYSSEVWEPTKAEMKKLNQMLDKIIKRILMTPEATPREALYIETGLLDIETIIDKKRLSMMARLNRDKSDMMTNILDNPDCKWLKKNKTVMEKYEITDADLQGTEWSTKKTIREKVNIKFRNTFTTQNENKSKLSYYLNGKGDWKPEQTPEYMNILTRKQTSIIFKARTRMTKVKGNYKNGHRNLQCRKCIINTETHTHCLEECTGLHPDNDTKITTEVLFSDTTESLKNSAKTIEKIIEFLENC